MSLLKWGTITKLGVPRPQPQAVTEHMMQLVTRCPQEIGEGKAQHIYVWKFSLATGLSSLLAYSNKSLSYW